MTREEAISRLVEWDVARWGETERAAAVCVHSTLTWGRALHELAKRYELAGATRTELRDEARRRLTAEDWRVIRLKDRSAAHVVPGRRWLTPGA